MGKAQLCTLGSENTPGDRSRADLFESAVVRERAGLRVLPPPFDSVSASGPRPLRSCATSLHGSRLKARHTRISVMTRWPTTGPSSEQSRAMEARAHPPLLKTVAFRAWFLLGTPCTVGQRDQRPCRSASTPRNNPCRTVIPTSARRRKLHSRSLPVLVPWRNSASTLRSSTGYWLWQ